MTGTVAAPPAGTVNVPCHDPFDASGNRKLMPSVTAETSTKSVFNDESSPGAQPVPLTCTTVPGGPEAGAIVKFVTAACAPPVEAHRTAALTAPSSATLAHARARRFLGTWVEARAVASDEVRETR
jgi:hypothetical protein